MNKVLIIVGDAAETVDEPRVIDGNLVSGRTYHDHGRYIGPCIKLLIQARDKASKHSTGSL